MVNGKACAKMFIYVHYIRRYFQGIHPCPDKGTPNFERYAAMAISASNIHHIGAIIMARKLEAERRKKRLV
jgi:hypothetical protein